MSSGWVLLGACFSSSSSFLLILESKRVSSKTIPRRVFASLARALRLSLALPGCDIMDFTRGTRQQKKIKTRHRSFRYQYGILLFSLRSHRSPPSSRSRCPCRRSRRCPVAGAPRPRRAAVRCASLAAVPRTQGAAGPRTRRSDAPRAPCRPGMPRAPRLRCHRRTLSIGRRPCCSSSSCATG